LQSKINKEIINKIDESAYSDNVKKFIIKALEFEKEPDHSNSDIKKEYISLIGKFNK
jgi:hypothetical protein